MPKQTFFNLAEQKRRMIIEAAVKEFSRVPIFEASISNIVKEADIPRGSFYQYFEDKDDLYFFLLGSQSVRQRKDFIACLKKNGGNLFSAVTETFSLLLEELRDEERLKFYRNVFLNMNYKTEKTFTAAVSNCGQDQRLKEIIEVLDQTGLNAEGEEEIGYLLQITVNIMLQNVIQKFAKEMTDEEALRSLAIQLDLVKRGLLKETE